MGILTAVLAVAGPPVGAVPCAGAEFITAPIAKFHVPVDEPLAAVNVNDEVEPLIVPEAPDPNTWLAQVPLGVCHQSTSKLNPLFGGFTAEALPAMVTTVPGAAVDGGGVVKPALRLVPASKKPAINTNILWKVFIGEYEFGNELSEMKVI